ncbi:hypothetical protein Ndes2526B_g05065 [Nannochloris sp. 'desiccata']|nr:hypothetical protein KSW81_000005 [Chlorella desiccata (nom. nud.)]KAH7619814.1 hypothetical protein NADE_008097 [Chlorella desiccata (nom. nud.)]
MQGRGSAQRGARPERSSARKQEPLQEDQENKLNPRSARPRKNLDQGEASSPALANTTTTFSAGGDIAPKDDINDGHIHEFNQHQEQGIKNEKPTDNTTRPLLNKPQQKQKRRQQRQDPQLFQDLPSHADVRIRKKRARQEAEADSDPDADFDDEDFALAAAEEEEEEENGGDRDYHPVVEKQRLLLKKQKPKQSQNQQQQRGIHSPGVGVAARRARLARKASTASASATAAAAGAKKKKKNGAKKVGNKAADATSGGEDAKETPPSLLFPPASTLPLPSPVLPATAAAVVAAAASRGQPLPLDAQVKALLVHTASMEERISYKDSEIASLNAVVAALHQTVMMQQNNNNRNDGAAAGAAGVAGSQSPSLCLPPPTRREELVHSLQRMDANISSCASNLNHHSKQIQAIITELNASNQNTNQVFTVLRQLKEGFGNLEHHTMTHAAGVAGCQAEIARIDEFLKEYKKEIKKKVEVAVKVAQGVRPSWDVSPRAAPAGHLF